MTPEERDRLTRLETNAEHMAQKIDAAAKKIDEMHTVLMKAKGARWAVIVTASIVGFVVSMLTQAGALLKLMFVAK